MPGTYKSIKDPGPANRMGGFQQKLYIIPYAWLLTIQKAVDGKVSTAHVPITGKGFVEMYLTQDTGELDLKPQGGDDRVSFLGEGKFYHPGEGDDIVSFINLCKNERFLILCPLPGSSELIQCGDQEFQVNIRPNYGTTKNSGDGRGTMFDFKFFAADMIKYTAATIPMLPTA